MENIIASTKDGIEKFLSTINELFGNKKVLIDDCFVINDWYNSEYEEYAPGIFVIEKTSSTRVIDNVIDTTGKISTYTEGDSIQVNKDSSDTILVQVGVVKTDINYSLHWYSNNGSETRCIGVWDNTDDMALVKEGDEYILIPIDDFDPQTKFKLITDKC